MNNIERKEPTFGQPSENVNNANNKVVEPTVENPVKPTVKEPLSFSVRTTQSPGHTFNKVIKPTVQPVTESVESVKNEVVEPVKTTVATESKASAAAPKLGFTFTPVEKETIQTKPTNEPEKMEQPKTETASMERVIPTATTEPSKAKGEKVPSKYRRLGLVALLALALLAVFLFLKPKAPSTDEGLPEQGNSLPIEFRPVDEEEAKRAEEEAKARLQAEQEAQAQQSQEQEQNQAQTEQVIESNSTEVATTEPTQTVETVTAPAVETAPVQAEPVTTPVVKPATTNSVIYQAEKPAQAVKTTQQSAKTASQNQQPAKALKPATSNTVKAESKPQTQTKVATVKPAEKTVKAEQAKAVAKPATNTAQTASPAVASKTITVQKGVSLFQNFRDNGLEANLPDLNKMTKLNGATSRLQPGQKITVRLDKNNRITEMNIGSGRYIRQADGSYIYK